MADMLNRLLGMLMPNAASRRDAPAAATPPMQIEGARNAPQLVMLPKDANLPDRGMEQIMRQHAKPAPRIVQVKADGIRAVYIDGRIVSREGAPLDCTLHCQPGIDRMIEAAGYGPMVIDGEYVAHEGFAATLQEHKRGVGEGVFWAFDCLPLADWRRGRCDVPIERRLGMLKQMVLGSDSMFVGMLDAWTLDPIQTAGRVRELWAAGYEGVVSKRVGSPYVSDRSDDWLRIKQTHTVDGMLVDLMARPDGTLKRMIVNVIDRTSPKPITVVVGTGWTEAEGRTLVRMHDGALTDSPMWVEISFQLSTGVRRDVRGARFHRVRSSKGITA